MSPSREFQDTSATDSLSSSEVLDTTTTDSLSSSEFLDATTTVPTPPPEFLYTTTTPPPGCWDGDKFYKVTTGFLPVLTRNAKSRQFGDVFPHPQIPMLRNNLECVFILFSVLLLPIVHVIFIVWFSSQKPCGVLSSCLSKAVSPVSSQSFFTQIPPYHHTELFNIVSFGLYLPLFPSNLPL